jgi:hypothetical protein
MKGNRLRKVNSKPRINSYQGRRRITREEDNKQQLIKRKIGEVNIKGKVESKIIKKGN